MIKVTMPAFVVDPPIEKTLISMNHSHIETFGLSLKTHTIIFMQQLPETDCCHCQLINIIETHNTLNGLFSSVFHLLCVTTISVCCLANDDKDMKIRRSEADSISVCQRQPSTYGLTVFNHHPPSSLWWITTFMFSQNQDCVWAALTHWLYAL